MSGEDKSVSGKLKKKFERLNQLHPITSGQVGTSVPSAEERVPGQKGLVFRPIEADRTGCVAGCVEYLRCCSIENFRRFIQAFHWERLGFRMHTEQIVLLLHGLRHRDVIGMNPYRSSPLLASPGGAPQMIQMAVCSEDGHMARIGYFLLQPPPFTLCGARRIYQQDVALSGIDHVGIGLKRSEYERFYLQHSLHISGCSFSAARLNASALALANSSARGVSMILP